MTASRFPAKVPSRFDHILKMRKRGDGRPGGRCRDAVDTSPARRRPRLVHATLAATASVVLLALAIPGGPAGVRQAPPVAELAGAPTGVEGDVDRLAAPSSAERDAAAERLAVGGASARAALRRAVRHSRPAVRRRARALLRRLDRAAGAGRDAASREDPGEQAAALIDDVRRAAARTLVPHRLVMRLAQGASGPEIDCLARLVHDGRLLPSSAVLAARRIRADAAVGEQRAPASTATRSLLRDAAVAHEGPLRRAAVALLSAVSCDTDDDAGGAAAFAADPSAGVRREVAHAIGCAPRRALRPVADALASDPDPGVRCAALRALARFPGAPRPEPAHEAAWDGDPRVRAAAAELLGPRRAARVAARAGDAGRRRVVASARRRRARRRAARRRALSVPPPGRRTRQRAFAQ